MLAIDIINRMRFHLNDLPSTYYTTTILIPPLNIAIDDLRGELIDNNVPITNVTSAVIVIDPGTTEISTTSTPSLPVGLVEIQEIKERSWGTSEPFVPLNREEFLPYGFPTTASIIYWSWQEEKIKLNIANSKREILINYIKTVLPDVVSQTDEVIMIRAMPFLAYRGAALAAENLGEDVERAASLNNNAGRELDKLINMSVKGKQVMPVRRKPFISGAYSR